MDCPMCQSPMMMTFDHEWRCENCDTVMPSAGYGYCSFHDCSVEYEVFRLWKSVCFTCRHQHFCVAYLKGEEYGR